MPPKKKSFRAGERVDAITNEAIGKRFIQVKVGHGDDNVLYYNTSTLIRIAKERGRFMQPPYFREPCTAEQIAEIEEAEGRGPISLSAPPPLPRVGEFLDAQEEVDHIEGFEDLIRTIHEPVNPKHLFVCPHCFPYASIGLLRAAVSERTLTDRAARKMEETLELVDPLDTCSYLLRDGGLTQVVFPNATDFKDHIKRWHHKTGYSATDHTVRARIHSFLAGHNNCLSEKRLYHRMHTTTTKYWHCDAHFNVFRYNRLFEAVHRIGSDLTGVIAGAAADADEEEQSESDDNDIIASDDSGGEEGSGSTGGEESEEESDDHEIDELEAIARRYERQTGECRSSSSTSDEEWEESEEEDEEEEGTRPPPSATKKRSETLTNFEKRELGRMNQQWELEHPNQRTTLHDVAKKKKKRKDEDTESSSTSNSSEEDGTEEGEKNSSSDGSSVKSFVPLLPVERKLSMNPTQSPLKKRPRDQQEDARSGVALSVNESRIKKMVIDTQDDEEIAETCKLSSPQNPPKAGIPPGKGMLIDTQDENFDEGYHRQKPILRKMVFDTQEEDESEPVNLPPPKKRK